MPNSPRSRSIACPACGAQAEWNPAKQLLVCPFCGTESPFTDRCGDRARSRRSIWPRRCASCRTSCAAGMAEKRSVQCQSCKAVIGLRSRRASARTASSADRRRSSTTRRSRRRSGRRACCRSRSARRRSASRSAAGTRASGSRRTRSRAGRSSTACTASTSRTGRSTRRRSARGRPRRATTTTRPRRTATTRAAPQTRQVQHVRWEPASGVVDHFFDDEPVPGTQGRVARAAAAGRAVSDDASSCPTTRRSCRASSSSTTRSCCFDAAQRSQDAMTGELQQLCAARRFLATPIAIWRFTRSSRNQTFKHILVPVWLLAYIYGARSLPGGGERLHRPDGRASTRRAPGRSRSSCCSR